jgi:transposase-like protein
MTTETQNMDTCPNCGLEAHKPDERNKYGEGDLRYCPDCEKEWSANTEYQPAPDELRDAWINSYGVEGEWMNYE